MCTSCGTGYNVAFINSGEYHMPPLLPKVDGICDNCGTATLVQRPDDNEEVVRRRYNALILPSMPPHHVY